MKQPCKEYVRDYRVHTPWGQEIKELQCYLGNKLIFKGILLKDLKHILLHKLNYFITQLQTY